MSDLLRDAEFLGAGGGKYRILWLSQTLGISEELAAELQRLLHVPISDRTRYERYLVRSRVAP